MQESPPQPSSRVLIGIAAISMVQLAFELMLVKLSYYEFGALSFGVVGLAMLGVSLAAPMVRALGGGQRAVERALVLLPLVALATGALAFSWNHEITEQADTVQRILVGGAAGLALMALSSVPVFAPIDAMPGAAPRLYGASLLGGALGAPIALALMQASGDARTFAVLIALAALGAPLARSRAAQAAVVGVSIGAGAVALGALPALDRAAHPKSLYVETNAVSRIDVVKDRGQAQFRTAGVNAGTPLISGRFNRPDAPITRKLSAAPFRLGGKRVLILGSGGGQNVAQALAYGVPDVIAVEINGMIPGYMRATLDPTLDVYQNPAVTLIVDEGREAAAKLGREAPFDLIYVPIATLYGSSGQTFTMTYLMTEEALVQYMGSLTPDGVVAVYAPSMLGTKVATALARALERRGVTEVASHMMLADDGERFLVAATPGRALEPAERELLGHKATVIDAAPAVGDAAHVRRLSDDNPFLYNDTWEPSFQRTIFGWSVRSLRTGFLWSLAALALVAVAAGARRPHGISRWTAAGPVAAGAALGLAFSAWQTVVMQRLAFLIGHPALATAVVLPCTLLGTGLGSWLVGRMQGPRARLAAGGALVAGIALVAAVPPASLVRPEWAWSLRWLATALFATVPFIPMGTFFPAVMERAREREPGLVAWVWLANGVASVVGSLLVLYGAMLVGFQTLLAVPAALYAAVSLWEALGRGARAKGADRAFAIAVALILVVTVLALEQSTSTLR